MSSTPNATPGRVIRAALVILFFGTIVLGALSFVIYFRKEEKVLQRSIRYAAGLRRELDDAGLSRHQSIINAALAKPAADARVELSAYLESTLGPENMGYTVRAVEDKANPSGPSVAYDVELTGTKRAQDVVLVICGITPPLTALSMDETARPLAAMLGVAQAVTGQPTIRTVRFVCVRDVEALKAYYVEAVGVRDRISHVLLLGSIASVTDAEILKTLHLEGRGTVLQRPDVTGALLPAAIALKTSVQSLADRL